MVTLGYLLIVVHLIFLLLAGLLIGASFGGFSDASGYRIASAVLAILLWGAFAFLTIFYGVRNAFAMARGQSDRADAGLWWANFLFLIVTILSAVTGLILAFGTFASCGPLWLPGLYHWAGLVGTILGFTFFFILPLLVRACMGTGGEHAKPHRWFVPLLTALPVALLWGFIWLGVYLWLSGDIKESEYPARASSPYKLPFPAGEDSWVIQGNNSGHNHSGREKYAWDFRRRCGTPVLAARGGTIRAGSVDTYDDFGTDAKPNFIEVEHDDKSIGRYFHIQKGSIVKRSGTVVQGEELAKVGNVGNSLTGHIHFVVEQGGKCIPITFQDVTDDKGIPRTFSSYTSGNKKVK